MAAVGYVTFAGVRKERDAEAYRAQDKAPAGPGSIVPILIDVTDAESIAGASRTVAAEIESRGGAGLDGLVNNAGTGLFGPVEYLPLQGLRQQFEVNVVGLIAVTQAFLPLIREAKGRIVNIGSVGDNIAMPFGGALCASKSAVRLLNDALRQELSPAGIRVVLVRPASIHTPAVEKLSAEIEKTVDALPRAGKDIYSPMIRSFAERALARERNGSPPETVAATVVKALTDRVPATRYRAGKDSGVLTLLPRLLSDRRLDAVRRNLFGLPKFRLLQGELCTCSTPWTLWPS
jgi:NAD(P)-dependent dehydrogenase (short-subunit alcohol dehydrogenase family)